MTNEQTGCLHPTTTLFVKRENDEITILIVELKNDDLILGTDGRVDDEDGTLTDTRTFTDTVTPGIYKAVFTVVA